MNTKRTTALVKVESVQTAMARVVGNVLDQIAPSNTRLHHRFVPGHSESVNALAFAPDGSTFASMSSDRTIRVWDVATGRCLHALSGGKSSGCSILYSLDGQTLISGYAYSGDIKVWDASTGRCLNTITETGAIHTVALSSEGQVAFGQANGGQIYLWDIAKGRRLYTLNGHSDSISLLAYSPNGEMLVSGSRDSTIRLWEVSTGQCIHLFTGYHGEGQISALAYSPNGETLASKSRGSRTIELWDVSSGRYLRSLTGHKSKIESLVYSPDGNIIASGCDGGMIKLWDISTGRCLFELVGYHDESSPSTSVESLAFSPDGNTLVAGIGVGGKIILRLWNVSTGRCLYTLTGHDGTIDTIAFSPDGDMFASGSRDNTIRLWDTATGECLLFLGEHSKSNCSAAYSPNGKTLVLRSRSGVGVWDISTGCYLHTLDAPTSTSFDHYPVAYSPDGNILVTESTLVGVVTAWDVSTGRCLTTLTGHKSRIKALAFSSDGQTVASGDVDGAIRLWDTSTGRCLHTLFGHQKSVNALAFSPDGETLASGSTDATVWVWDVFTGRARHIINTFHAAWGIFNALVFSPDGKTIALCCSAAVVHIVDALTGRHVTHFLLGSSGGAHSVAYSSDGETLIVGANNNTIRFWDISTGRCLKVLDGENLKTNRHPVKEGYPSYTLTGTTSASSPLIWNNGYEIRFVDPQTYEILGCFYSERGIWTTSPTPDAPDGYVYAPDPTSLVVARIDAEGGLTPLSDDDPERVRYLMAHNRWERVRAHIFGSGWTEPLGADRQIGSTVAIRPRLGAGQFVESEN